MTEAQGHRKEALYFSLTSSVADIREAGSLLELKYPLRNSYKLPYTSFSKQLPDTDHAPPRPPGICLPGLVYMSPVNKNLYLTDALKHLGNEFSSQLQHFLGRNERGGGAGRPPSRDHLLSWNVAEDGSRDFLLISVCKSALT